jgi:ABC-type glycerol-3-phosphate transport system substrate-binding protein
MTMTFRLTIAALAASIAVPVWADDCAPQTASIRILSNDFPALHAVNARAQECVADGTEFVLNQTSEHKNIQVPALQANPAEYTVAVVANGSIVPLLNEGLVRPLDDLVAKHGASLKPNQLIKVNGQTMAVAFMANSQHLFYRKDILAEAGLEPPTTYEEVLAAAEAIKNQGLMDHPLTLNTAVGWHLGEEFVNMYNGFGGEFFKPGTAEPAINNDTGVAALEMLKSLVAFSNPDFLTFDGNTTNALWSSGEAAMAIQWGSRASQMMDGQSINIVKENTVVAGMPTVAGGGTPASTLWWDGFTIAANISDAEAEASFIAMVHGIQPALLEDHSDKAIWLLDGYSPGPSAVGVFENANRGTPAYPMLPFMGLLHGVLGNELGDFLQGRESAEQALADVEASYIQQAKQQGFLN